MNKLASLAFICTGFVIGQGAMFLAQTYLILEGQLSVVGTLGIGLGFLSLLFWVSDMGGVFIIPKYMSEGYEKVMSFLLARVFFSVVLYYFWSMIKGAIEFDALVENVLSVDVYVVFIGALGVTGLTDYRQKNYVAGPLSGLCWFISAVLLLVLFDGNDNKKLGGIVGFGFLVGLVLYVFAQLCLIRKDIYLCLSCFLKVKYKMVWGAFVDGMSYNISFMSSQVYGRIVPLLIEKCVGVDYSGAYIYARNIINMTSQFVMFSRRVEFRCLVKINVLRADIKDIVLVQRYSFTLMITSIVMMIAFIILAEEFIVIDKWNYIFDCMVWLVCVFVLFFFSSMLSQVMLSVGKVVHNTIVQTSSIIVALSFIWLSIDSVGMYSIYLGEIVLNVIRIALLTMLLAFYRRYDGRVAANC